MFISRLGVREVSVLLGVSEQTVRDMEKDGTLIPSAKTYNGYRKYSFDEVEKHLGTGNAIDFIPLLKNDDLSPLSQAIHVIGLLWDEDSFDNNHHKSAGYGDGAMFLKRHGNCPKHLLKEKYVIGEICFPVSCDKQKFCIATELEDMTRQNGIACFMISSSDAIRKVSLPDNLKRKVPRVMIGLELSGNELVQVWYERISINQGSQEFRIMIPERLEIVDEDGNSFSGTDFELFRNTYGNEGIMFSIKSKKAKFCWRKPYIANIVETGRAPYRRSFVKFSEGMYGFTNCETAKHPEIHRFVASYLI